MSKPIFTAFRQFLLSAVLRSSALKPSVLADPEPNRRSLQPEGDTWMFDAPRELAACKADYGQAAARLSGQLSNVRELLSRISPTAPVPVSAYDYCGVGNGVVWSDTLLFDGEPVLIGSWDDELVDGDMGYLFDGADAINDNLMADELFGGYGRVPALAS